MRRSRGLVAIALAGALAACAAPTPDASPVPLPELAEDAVELPADDQPSEPMAAGPTSGPTDDAAASGGSDVEPSPTVAEPTASPPSGPRSPSSDGTVHTLATVDDPSGDAGLETPGYADVVRVVIEDTGSAARISIDLASDVPSTLADGEVIGLGIDWFTSGGDESDVQLFADGGSDGWRAYLQTADGFVAYPGTFAIGGRRIRFEVPWTALGAPRTARVSTFLDWSQQRTLVNAAGSDRAPDRGRATVDRS